MFGDFWRRRVKAELAVDYNVFEEMLERVQIEMGKEHQASDDYTAALALNIFADRNDIPFTVVDEAIDLAEEERREAARAQEAIPEVEVATKRRMEELKAAIKAAQSEGETRVANLKIRVTESVQKARKHQRIADLFSY